MKEKKIIISLIIIYIVSICVIYNFIKTDYLNNEKIIVKAMTGTEYENNITELNTAHEEYATYIEESKKKIASAITEMGVDTSAEDTLETMANNIKDIEGIKFARGSETIKTTATMIDTGLTEISFFIIDNGQEGLFAYFNGGVIHDNYDYSVLDSVESGKITIHYKYDLTANWYACGK